MEIEKSDVWQRHQLAAVERMQRDLSRYTHPVIRAVGLCSVAYLASWAAVMVLGAEAMAMVAVAAKSGAVLVLCAPAFALAVGLERHFRRRLDSADSQFIAENGSITIERVLTASFMR